MGIPKDLDEAARIDGAGHIRILAQILLPLIKPVLISVGLFAFILYWNDVLGPLDLYLAQRAEYDLAGARQFPGAATAPTTRRSWRPPACPSGQQSLLYFLGQKYFIEGIVLSGPQVLTESRARPTSPRRHNNIAAPARGASDGN